MNQSTKKKKQSRLAGNPALVHEPVGDKRLTFLLEREFSQILQCVSNVGRKAAWVQKEMQSLITTPERLAPVLMAAEASETCVGKKPTFTSFTKIILVVLYPVKTFHYLYPLYV